MKVDETIIKPIPKYIIKKIKSIDKKHHKDKFNRVRFYNYFAIWKKHLMQITVAVKNKYNKWYCKQVVIHCDNGKICYVKDIKFTQIAGYSVGWYAEGLSKYQTWFESDDWGYADDKYFFIPYITNINPELALKIEKYKYSQVTSLEFTNELKYLRMYEKYPQAEYLLKLGLEKYCMSKTILNKLAKDKKFRKWIINHSNELSNYSYYISAIMKAYKENRNLMEIQKFEYFLRPFMKKPCYTHIKTAFCGNVEKFYKYITKLNMYEEVYDDYLTACEYLGLDMSLPKNLMPHDLSYWHNIRTEEYHNKKMEEDKKQMKQFCKNFKIIADKYKIMQRKLNENYITLIAHSPKELTKEGEALHHCVGHMGYDKKFVNEESLIFFVRLKEQPTIPLVTIEYDPKTHKILQCYAIHNSQPNEQILEYINKIWLPYANNQIKQITI
ncbi:MAG: PcfJ domain-containing protein [Clostridia bacterium]|nr:PcfJ domain-containing protein [Clostridia bacterium]